MLKTTLIPFALGLLVLAGCTQKQNTLSSSEKAEGFVLLFDGQSLQGWRAYMEDPMEAAWSVQDGALVLKGGSEKGSYANIVTTGEYDDFDLRFEWKIEPGSNTGLMFHVKEGPKMPYLTGPEYQLLDDEGFRGGDGKPVPPEEYTASHYAIEAAYQEVTKPVGEWNTSRILVVGNVVQYWLNEVKTADYEMHSEKWNKQVADAKFGNWKTFGTTETGHLALQDHGHGAWFRNIKIKELSKH
ncbi:MAG: DUF1080 domain-containing protein [Verrucomicrobia bacterium]|nr:DUF1080 domain-containing protein [Verrucomicrobiota bacterium]